MNDGICGKLLVLISLVLQTKYWEYCLLAFPGYLYRNVICEKKHYLGCQS